MILGVRASSSNDDSDKEGDTTVLTLSVGVRGGSLDEGAECVVTLARINDLKSDIARDTQMSNCPRKFLQCTFSYIMVCSTFSHHYLVMNAITCSNTNTPSGKVHITPLSPPPQRTVASP